MRIAITSAAITSTGRGQQQFKELSVEHRREAPLRSIVYYNNQLFLEARMSGDKTSPFIETMSRRRHRVRPPLKLRTHADDRLPTHTHTQPHTPSDQPLQLSARCQITHRTRSSSPSRCSVPSTFPRSRWFQENTISSPGDISPNVPPDAVDKHLLLLPARSAPCCP